MTRTTRVAALLTAILAGGSLASAAEPKLYGSLQGEVRNITGVAQMGATVKLFNRNERMIRRTMTDSSGRFNFDALAPDIYNISVSLATFIPASKTSIPVKAGMQSYLNVELTDLFSSIEFVYAAPGQSGALSEDWKWSLRSNGSLRPVLRFLPREQWESVPGQQPGEQRAAIEITRAMMKLSAGDAGISNAIGHEADLGTAFALATTLFNGNELRLAGNVGFATASGAAITGFRTNYTRAAGSASPDVELTVRQAGVRQRAGDALVSSSPNQSSPVLRTLSLKVLDQKKLAENITLDYGSLVEAVAYLDHMTLVSPFARLTYDLGTNGTVELGYSNGAPATSLIQPQSDSELQRDLSDLAMFPRISVADGRVRVQRSTNYEIGYRKRTASRTFAAGYYQEDVKDAAITMSAPSGAFGSGDLLPDISSNSSIFNLGCYRTQGFMTSVSQDLSDNWSVSVAYGMGGALSIDESQKQYESAGEFRDRMHPVARQWASTRVSGLLPATGTRVVASYAWNEGGALAPSHAWITQRMLPSTGLNIQVRQPIPALSFGSSKLEMNAEVRNLLAQGYLPVNGRDGRTVYLIQFPRALRGGFSLIF